jgi:hypothetical protein
MTDPVSLFVTIGTQLKLAADIAIGLSNIHTSAEVNAKAIELQRIILSLLGDAVSAQSEQSAMVHRISDLEKEIADIKAWEETKQRYELHQPMAGTFVYTLKVQSRGTEPTHWICTNCYEDSRRSILQIQSSGHGTDHFVCPRCKAAIFVSSTLKDLGMA